MERAVFSKNRVKKIAIEHKLRSELHDVLLIFINRSSRLKYLTPKLVFSTLKCTHSKIVSCVIFITLDKIVITRMVKIVAHYPNNSVSKVDVFFYNYNKSTISIFKYHLITKFC